MLVFKADPKKFPASSTGSGPRIAVIHRDADDRKLALFGETRHTDADGEWIGVKQGGAEIQLLTNDAGVTVINKGSHAYHVKTRIPRDPRSSELHKGPIVHEGTLAAGHNFRLRGKGTAAAIRPA